MSNIPQPPTHKQETVFDQGPCNQQLKYLQWLRATGQLDDSGLEALRKLEEQGGEARTADIDPFQPHL